VLKKFIFALIALGLTGALLEVLSRSAETSALLKALPLEPLGVDLVGAKYLAAQLHGPSARSLYHTVYLTAVYRAGRRRLTGLDECPKRPSRLGGIGDPLAATHPR
jgi:hypothetical protein